MLEVTHGYTIRTDDFYFVRPFLGLECFARAGEVFAVDGGADLRTPYDGCVVVMPNHSAVRGHRPFRPARRAAGAPDSGWTQSARLRPQDVPCIRARPCPSALRHSPSTPVPTK